VNTNIVGGFPETTICADCIYPEGSQYTTTFTVEVKELVCDFVRTDNSASIETEYIAYYRTTYDPGWHLPGNDREVNRPFSF
jgi:hypothetical protein